MKFVIASHSERLAGAERSLYAIVSAALEAGHQVAVTLPRQGPLREKLAASFPEIELITLPTRAWMQGAKFEAKTIPRTLVSVVDAAHHFGLYRRLLPDLVVVNSSVIPGPMFAGWLRRIPTVVIVRESILSNTQLYSIIPRKLLVRLIEHFSVRRIAVSHFVARQLNEPAIVDYPDVRRDLHKVAVAAQDDNDVDSTVRRTLRVVMLGSFSPEKGQMDAIQAVTLAKAQGADVSLSLYGYAHQHELAEISKWCSTNGMEEWISHQGFTDDPLRAYEEADVSVVCSKNEAYGRVTAESILAGVPVVGYDQGGTTEILKSGGGIACEATPEALAEALVKLSLDGHLLQDLRSRCSALEQRGSIFGDSAKTVDLLVSYAKSRPAAVLQ